MAKTDLNLLKLNKKTPSSLRLALLIFVYGCEFISIIMQTWLFLDIDFHTMTTDFKINL